MIKLKPGAHIHLIGICGTAMASFAALLKERGFKITGSDQNVYPPMSTFLKDKGIEIMEGYKSENLNCNPDYVVVGNVIQKKFEETQALLASNIPYGSFPETLRDFVIEDRHSVVICGTHGKTTTTSMAAWICDQANLNPGFLIGGIAKNFSTSFKNPQGDWFIIEGDEYDTAFFAKVPKYMFYKPQSVILSSVEFDHADIYKDMDAVMNAFEGLMEIIPDNGLLIYNAGDENIKKLIPLYSGKKISYGTDDGDWQAKNIEYLKDGIQFDIEYKGKQQQQLFIPMFGDYNALNALAVYILAKEHQWPTDLKKSFAQFQGVKRRQELIGQPGEIQIIEDFAHHPTAVHATLKSFKKRKDAGKLFAIFEPRSATSRRNYFQQQYIEALAQADVSYICRPYDKDRLGEMAMDTEKLAQDITAKGSESHEIITVEEAINSIKSKARPGDTVLIMSNGAFQGIYQKILSSLGR